MNPTVLHPGAQPPVHIKVIDPGAPPRPAEPYAPVMVKDETAHLHRIHAALLGLERAVTETLAGAVSAEVIDLAVRPVLARMRTALHSPGRTNTPVDLDDYQLDLSGIYPDNLDRAACAAAAVRAFGLRTRQLGPHAVACVDEVEEMAADLVGDLMHLLDAIGGDAEHTLERGLRYHEDEVDEEELDEDDLLRELIGA